MWPRRQQGRVEASLERYVQQAALKSCIHVVRFAYVSYGVRICLGLSIGSQADLETVLRTVDPQLSSYSVIP